MGKVLLDNVCNYLGLQWSIQNNIIKIFPAGASTGITAVSLSPTSGIIESPQKENIDNKEFTKKENNAISGQSISVSGTRVKRLAGDGWKIKALLQPDVEPGSVIVAESAEIPSGSRLRVIEVEHSGDTHGPEWTSTIITRIM